MTPPALYRIYPVLWDGSGSQQAQQVYAIDRVAPNIPSCCSSRPRADPATAWDSPTFQRLLPPPDVGPCGSTVGVTWATLPAWLSFAMGRGYTVQGKLNAALKPYSDIYILG
jgi:hypothetical protein